ncbi:enolase C-terminal domain-like protein [Georgenia soli]|uniref:enolase C-terminal domain-like protein n=1 Tax=Georgenia soli TaxID=638953 RepID=UPI001FE271C2|nr:enolase C-terminal domain-like protein [Georgenia soli]
MTAVTARALTVPTDAPEADGTFAWDSTTMVLVQARAADQAGTGWTYAPGATSAVVQELLAPVVTGRDAMDVPGAADAMARAVRNAGRPGLVGCAISAVDVALWDLKARLLGLALHQLLGAVRAEVPVYGSGGFTTYDEARLAEQLGGWVHGQGIPRVKIKIGEARGTAEDRDVLRMRQARRVIDDAAELFVDANGAYGRAQAVRVLERVGDPRITWFEEPVSSDDLVGLAQVRAAVPADVAAGEYAWDLFTVRRMCESGAVDCQQLDVSRCGGITEFLRAAAVAAAHGLEVSGHCAPHLHAHVAAAVPNLRHLEWFHDHVRVESMVFDGTLDPAGGTVRPDPGSPGHGLTVREDVVPEHLVR